MTDRMARVGTVVIPVVFAAGGLAYQIQTLGDGVEQFSTDLRSHEIAEGHQVTVTKISVLEEKQKEMMTEQRVQGENIAAICQATGAMCR
jgi:hypothetical protein